MTKLSATAQDVDAKYTPDQKKRVIKSLLKRMLGEKISLSLWRSRRRLSVGIKELVGRIRHALGLRCWYARFKLSPQLRQKYASCRGALGEGPLRMAAGSVEGIESGAPHVLFVTEKWCDCNPEMGITNSEHNFFGSLASTGLATHEAFHFDEYCLSHKRACDIALMARCMESRPDILFYTWCGLEYSPRWSTLSYIRRRLKLRVVVFWPEVTPWAASAFSCIDVNLVVHAAVLARVGEHERYLRVCTPQDPRIYNDPGTERDVDVSFVGSITKSHFLDRRAGIAALRSSGIDVFQSGGQREHRLSVEEYAGVFKRSKMSMNFCMGGGVLHMKGRAFEITMCGAMLLAPAVSEVSHWFEPMVEYVPFEDEADLVEKVRYYLAHDAEREEIARRGHEKAVSEYSAEKFWALVLGKALGTAPGKLHDALVGHAARTSRYNG